MTQHRTCRNVLPRAFVVVCTDSELGTVPETLVGIDANIRSRIAWYLTEVILSLKVIVVGYKMNPQYWLRDRAIGGSTIGALVWLGSCSWQRFTVDNLGKLFGNKMHRLQWSDMLPTPNVRFSHQMHWTFLLYVNGAQNAVALLVHPWYFLPVFTFSLCLACVLPILFSLLFAQLNFMLFFLHWLRCLYSCTMNLKKVASSCDSTSPLVRVHNYL